MITQTVSILDYFWSINMAMSPEELKKLLHDELVKKAREKQANIKASAVQYAAIARKEEEKRDSEKAEKLWGELEKKSKETVESALKGYETWTSSIYAMLELCYKLREALSADNPLKSVVNAIIDKILPIVSTLKNTVVDKFSPDPKVTLPTLEQHVKFTEEDTLEIGSLPTRSDGKPFTAEQQAVLNNVDTGIKMGLNTWLGSNGYIVNPAKENGYINEITDEPLTKETFEALRDDPDRGLNKYLSGKYQVTFGTAPVPTPRPRC